MKYSVKIPFMVIAKYKVEAETPEEAKEVALAIYDNEKWIHDCLPSNMAHYYHCAGEDKPEVEKANPKTSGCFWCTSCKKPHRNEFSLTCRECDAERESGDLTLEDECDESDST